MSEKVTVEDLRNHCTEKSAWIAIRGKVYDVTAFMRRHPGGRDALLLGEKSKNIFSENPSYFSRIFVQQLAAMRQSSSRLITTSNG